MSLTSRHLMPDGIRFALSSIKRQKNVVSASLETEEFYRAIVNIKRRGFYPNLKVYIADVYVLTASDVIEVIDNYPSVNCIVVISNWDHYTNLAKEEGLKNSLGIFTIDEFLEALNYRGKEFLDIGTANRSE